jgi:transposase
MITISYSAADVDAWRYWRFQHPDARVQGRMAALYLRSQGIATPDIIRLCGISKASFHRSLNASVTGGIEPLKQIDPSRPQSALAPHRLLLEAYIQQHPPAMVAEAAAKLAELTGVVRKPTPVRIFWRALGMPPRKVGMISAQADVAAQEGCTHVD